MAKLTKEEASGLQRDAQTYVGLLEYAVKQLPRTPGRDVAERGLSEVREGLAQVRHESEGGGA